MIGVESVHPRGPPIANLRFDCAIVLPAGRGKSVIESPAAINTQVKVSSAFAREGEIWL